MENVFRIVQIDTSLLEAERFRVEKCLAELLPKACVMEVGSAAIPGVLGKQDLDFMVRVQAKDFFDARRDMDAVFGRNPLQLSDDVFQGYIVKSPMDIAVQLLVAGSPYDTFERFLEALRLDSDLVEAYNALKRKWDGKSMSGYRLAKNVFIESVLSGLDRP